MIRVLITILLFAVLTLSGCSRGRPPARAGGPASPAQVFAAARPANLVICVLDATRADHVGCYGYPRDTTPNLDQLAREGVVFRQHFSASSTTLPSTASLFTGLYPDAHRMAARGELPQGAFLLAAALKRAGWSTALFTSNINVSPQMGLGAGFTDAFGGPRPGEEDEIREGDWHTPEGLTREFSSWVKRKRSARFFAYVHLRPPHLPYNAPEAFLREVTRLPGPRVQLGKFAFPQTEPPDMKGGITPPALWQDLYDANLRWGDWGLGEVVQALRAQGLLERTLLLVTSDHGEAFGEHGYVGHMRGVYNEQVHIPLVLRFPGGHPSVREVTALTQTVDLLPTVCELFGVSYPRDKVQGVSLLPLLTGARKTVREHAFAVSNGAWPSYLIRDPHWSLLLYRGGTLKALYDNSRDPGQRQNVAAAHPETVAELTRAFRSFARTQAYPLTEYLSPNAPAPRPEPPRRVLAPTVQRELRDLGYL